MRILIEDLPPARIRRIERRMRPGAFSKSGFLDGAESLPDVIGRDIEALESAGITPEQIADRLETLVQQAWRTIAITNREGDEQDHVSVDDLWLAGIRVGRFKVRGLLWAGGQMCPFGSCQPIRYIPCPDLDYGTWDFVVRNRDLGTELSFGGLLIHLIRNHHFFEGNVPHRVDPLRACRVLVLVPGEDYAPRWRTEWVWALQGGGGGTLAAWRAEGRHEDFLAAVDAPDVTVQAGARCHVYFKGDLALAMTEGQCWYRGPREVAGAIWIQHHMMFGIACYRRMERRYVEPEPGS